MGHGGRGPRPHGLPVCHSKEGSLVTSPGEPQQPRPDADDAPTIRCEACRSALDAPGREAVAFLLFEGRTVPVVGCADHLERFRATCGFATERTVELLQHRPAGGVPCPGCRLAPHNPYQPVVPVDDGVVAVLACSTHNTEIVERFRTGRRTRQQLTAPLDPPGSTNY